jgi:hypothetical protein
LLKSQQALTIELVSVTQSRQPCLLLVVSQHGCYIRLSKHLTNFSGGWADIFWYFGKQK